MKHSALTYSLLFLVALMAIVGGIGLFDSAVYFFWAMAIVPVLIGLNGVAVLRAEKNPPGMVCPLRMMTINGMSGTKTVPPRWQQD